MMMAPLAEIAWDEPADAIPAFLTLATIPLTFSIANGLAIGLTAHAALKLVRGQARPADAPLYILAALFIARFIYLAQA
jgi:AGZA family xanthine/uracil permease-like MFS transporter